MTLDAVKAPAQRKTSASRDRLMAAARTLFASQGYHATRPQDISKAAGLGHGTFYLHFADKKDCFLAFVEEAREALDAAVQAELKGLTGIEACVAATLSAIFEFSNANPGVLAAALSDSGVIDAAHDARANLIDRWARQWAGLVTGHAPSGSVMPVLEAEMLGAAIVGIIQHGGNYANRHGASRARAVAALTRAIVKIVS